MNLSKSDATYTLTIEMGIPIEMVIFEADVSIEIINMDQEKFHMEMQRPNLLVRLRVHLFV